MQEHKDYSIGCALNPISFWHIAMRWTVLLSSLAILSAAWETLAAEQNGAASQKAHQVGQGEVWSYRFVQPSYRRQIKYGFVGAEFKTVPASEFGELILNLASGEFVYQFWLHPRRHPRYRGESIQQGRPPKHLFVPTVAAGFDGETYWLALFPGARMLSGSFFRKAAADRATLVFLYPSRQELDSKAHDWLIYNRNWMRADSAPLSPDAPADASHEAESRYPRGHPWYSSAPLHRLLRYIGCEGWDHKSLMAALNGSEFVRPVTDHSVLLKFDGQSSQQNPSWFFRYRPIAASETAKGLVEQPAETGGAWIYWLEIDEKLPAIRRVQVRNSSSVWSGHWPYPTPFLYHVVRDVALPEPADNIFDYRMYAAPEARIEVLDSADAHPR